MRGRSAADRAGARTIRFSPAGIESLDAPASRQLCPCSGWNRSVQDDSGRQDRTAATIAENFGPAGSEIRVIEPPLIAKRDEAAIGFGYSLGQWSAGNRSQSVLQPLVVEIGGDRQLPVAMTHETPRLGATSQRASTKPSIGTTAPLTLKASAPS